MSRPEPTNSGPRHRARIVALLAVLATLALLLTLRREAGPDALPAGVAGESATARTTPDRLPSLTAPAPSGATANAPDPSGPDRPPPFDLGPGGSETEIGSPVGTRLPVRPGRLVDANGLAIVGATIDVWRHGRMGMYLYSTMNPKPAIAVATDAQGRFAIPARERLKGGPRHGEWWAHPHAEGFVSPPGEAGGWVKIPDDPSQPLALVLHRGTWLVCRPINGATGQPLRRGGYNVQNLDRQVQWNISWENVKDGLLRLGPYPPGRSTVTVESYECAHSTPISVVLEAGVEKHLGTIRLPAGGRIVGHVRGPDGKPAGPVELELLPEGEAPKAIWDHSETVYGRSESETAFGFQGLPAGRYTLRATSTGFGTLYREGLQVVDGEVITLDLRLAAGANVVLRLVDPDGRPIRGWAMRVGQGAGRWKFASTLMFEHPNLPDRNLGPDSPVATNEQGRVGCLGLQPGTWPVEARSMQKSDEWRPVGRITVAAGERPEQTLRVDGR